MKFINGIKKYLKKLGKDYQSFLNIESFPLEKNLSKVTFLNILHEFIPI